MRDRQNDRPLGQFAARLLVDVETDRDTLKRLIEKIGAGSNVVKELTGWLGEKATRVKLGHGAASEFGTFEVLEFLALGVLGKRALWRALDLVSAWDERLQGYDFKQLATSAQAQHESIEDQRLESAKTALKRAK